MPYRAPSRGLRPLRSRQKLEAAMRAANLSGAELAKVAGALGTRTSRQSIANLRSGATRAVRVELAAAIERALHVSDGEIFGRIGAEPPEELDDETDRVAS